LSLALGKSFSSNRAISFFSKNKENLKLNF
jgi:hypothetical protein